MNKVFEYMTLGIPFVSFDLIECRKASGDAALYAGNNDPIELAAQMARLLDDVDLQGRARRGRPVAFTSAAQVGQRTSAPVGRI